MSRSQRIQVTLQEKLEHELLIVEDESSKHHVPVGAETHFKLVIVSPSFVSLSRVERHRLVNKHLASELEQGLHALSLHLYTPDEWQKRQASTPDSPSCKDGYKHKKVNNA